MLTKEEIYDNLTYSIIDLESYCKNYTIVIGENRKYFDMRFDIIKKLIDRLKELED